MYAVFKSGGKQYKVAQNDVITLDKLEADEGSTILFDEVLMVIDGDKTTIGSPLVKNMKVSATILEQKKDKKIIVFKKKRRHNYRRKFGHRSHISVVRIEGIGENVKGIAAPKKKAAPKTEKPAPKVKTPAKAATKAPAAPKKEAAKPAAKAAIDDLTKISGVGPVIVGKLEKLGITTFAQIAAFKKADIADIDEKLSFKGRIDRDEWIKQAKELMKG